ncbi:MAG TPA: hypothetical protein VHY08_29330 [Bacillota bacterium]|nr:hypothetical protein [Bacillota bacterium]
MDWGKNRTLPLKLYRLMFGLLPVLANIPSFSSHCRLSSNATLATTLNPETHPASSSSFLSLATVASGIAADQKRRRNYGVGKGVSIIIWADNSISSIGINLSAYLL